jgi:hypothetical protein
MRILPAILLILLVAFPVAIASAADTGEQTAQQQYARTEHCATIPRYAAQPMPVGPRTGDPEKDTVAYKVERVETVCSRPANR